MAELLLELYSEEIPPQLQIEARSQLKQFIENSFKENHLKYKDLTVYSSPTRLTLYVKNLSEKIKIDAKEIKGPKVGSTDQVLPDEIEFWVDGEGRIHERLNYKNNNGKWNKELLYP